MKKLFFIVFALLLIIPVYAHVTINGHCYDLLWNPWMGMNQYVDCNFPNGSPSSCSGTYTGFTFDGSQVCLCVVGTSEECWPSVLRVNYLLAEDDTFVLTEFDERIILEK